MKLVNVIMHVSLLLCPLALLSGVLIQTKSANQDKEMVNQVLNSVFPRSVTAQELGYKPVNDAEDVSLPIWKMFDGHMRTLVDESCNVIWKCWEMGKDFISEGSNNKIHHYIPQLESLEKEVYTLVMKNKAFLSAQDSVICETHRQILDVIQTLLIDLIHVANITRETIANKKDYLIKKGKPSSGKLCGTLLNRLAPYLNRVDKYLDKIQYMWDLTVKAGHSTIVDPLQDVSEAIIQDYRSNPKSFSQEKMGAAIQHKLK